MAAVDIDVYSDLYETDDDLKKESALMSFVVENISNEIVNNHNAGLAYRGFRQQGLYFVSDK